MQDFHLPAIPEPLFHRLEQIGFTTPTPIQAQAIPPALEGADILGSAQTGTGKTGAYGIPLAARLITSEHACALVLLPTRELAMQVMKSLHEFTGRKGVRTALLIGGEKMSRQLSQLRVKPRLVVGTPGRVNDHLSRGTLTLEKTNFLVLDEVDRMLDMGFGVQLDQIARHLTSKDRQTLMFSATLPPNINKLAGKYLHEPMRISVGETHAPAANVKQENIKLTDGEKYTRLVDELRERTGSIIVFVKTKHQASRMAEKLQKLGHKADALHGDLTQGRRNRVTKAFRDQQYRILVATDVAARGLDIPHIEHVINYNLPQSPEDYIHRIGRTARAGAEGHAVNFICPADNGNWRAIQELLNPGSQPESSGKKKKRIKGWGKRSSSERRTSSNLAREKKHSPSKRKRRSNAERSDEAQSFSKRKSSEKAGAKRKPRQDSAERGESKRSSFKRSERSDSSTRNAGKWTNQNRDDRYDSKRKSSEKTGANRKPRQDSAERGESKRSSFKRSERSDSSTRNAGKRTNQNRNNRSDFKRKSSEKAGVKRKPRQDSAERGGSKRSSFKRSERSDSSTRHSGKRTNQNRNDRSESTRGKSGAGARKKSAKIPSKKRHVSVKKRV